MVTYLNNRVIVSKCGIKTGKATSIKDGCGNQ